MNTYVWLGLQGLRQPWTGVMHAGGVLADALVPKQSAASLRTVFGPKVLLLTHACPHHQAERRLEVVMLL